MAQTTVPYPASTVVLIRPDDEDTFEIFMNRRPENMETYAGIFVFPGGRVEHTDYSSAMLQRIRGLAPSEAQQILGSTLPAAHCLGHWVAAVRELFEEAGIQLFCNSAGNTLVDDAVFNRLAQRRAALQRGEIALPGLLEAENLVCDLPQLSYFFHRITPEHYRVRFDTRFYLAILPPGQTPLQVSEEVSESLWVSPQQALDRHEAGKFPMMPPTLAVLRTLVSHRTLAALRAAFRLA